MAAPIGVHHLDGVDLPIRVTESARRKKTVSARVVDGVIEMRVPVGLPDDERDDHIRRMAVRLARRASSDQIDLGARATELAKTYGLPLPRSIEWSTRQNHRWGSCTPAQGSIRISDRLSAFPRWVLDYVIVHELAHLVTAYHDEEFHRLVNRFPKAERAEGFLIAASLGHAGTAPGAGWSNENSEPNENGELA